MNLLSRLKVTGIRLADKINTLNDPFEDFTRPALPRHPEALDVKAARFEADLYQNFLLRGGSIVNYQIPQDNRLPIPLGDQALWHGIACATWAFKYAVERDDDTVQRLFNFYVGLQNHQVNGILIRGMSEAGEIQADASNDQATGHLLGLYAMWKYADEKSALRGFCARLMDQWATTIINSGHALINPDGKPTTYGQLIQGWKTDPLRLTLCLAIYAVAYHMTCENRYVSAYVQMLHQYGDLVVYPKVKLWWLDTVYDTHRAAIHLAILSNLASGPQQAWYRSGLARIRNMVRKQGNVWVNALCAWGDSQADDDKAIASKVLSEFTLEDKRFNPGRDRSLTYVVIRDSLPDWLYKKVLWNGQWMASQPLPRWFVRSQDFFWQRNLYSLDIGSDGLIPDSRFNGLDYLAAYRLSQLTGVVT